MLYGGYNPNTPNRKYIKGVQFSGNVIVFPRNHPEMTLKLKEQETEMQTPSHKI